MSSDPMVAALIRLCGDPAKKGSVARRHEVAQRLGVNEQTLYQIVKGIPLESGRPRGVGRQLREKLDAAFPGWFTEADAAGTSLAVPLAAQLASALTVIRNQLVHAHGDASAAAADALKLLALTPDSDRAFKRALDVLTALPGAASSAVQMLPTGVGKSAVYSRDLLERVAKGNKDLRELNLLMTYLDNLDIQTAREAAASTAKPDMDVKNTKA